MSSAKLAARMDLVHRSEIRKIFESAPVDAINLGLGEIQFQTPKLISNKANEILSKEILRYTPNAGLIEARNAVADYYKKDYISGENICLTVGVTEGIFITVLSLVEPGDEVLIADPAFVAYETVVRMAGGIPVFFNHDPENQFRLDMDSFRSAIGPKTKLIILNNPSNPLGISFNKEEIDLILDELKRSGGYLLVDEIYKDLFIDNEIETLFRNNESIIVVGGLSKSHCMTGWRIGWIGTVSPSLINAFISTHQYISTCAHSLSQKIVVTALSEPGMNAVDQIRRELIRNRDLMINFLKKFPKANILKNNASPFLMVTLSSDDRKLAVKFADQGVIVIPGSVFGSRGKDWIRINYGIPEDQLKKVFTRIEPVLSNPI